VVTSTRPDWVLLTYRLPREPSAPRLSLWRAIRRLGAIQLGDGLVALPHSPRNLEHLQWLAADIAEHDGTASVWHARADSSRDNDLHVAQLRTSADQEYRAVLEEAESASAGDLTPTERRRVTRRLRGQLRRIALRDHFQAPSGALARVAVDDLARSLETVRA
jgi:hypothetical protein